jgi:hypothetical protein
MLKMQQDLHKSSGVVEGHLWHVLESLFFNFIFNFKTTKAIKKVDGEYDLEVNEDTQKNNSEGMIYFRDL